MFGQVKQPFLDFSKTETRNWWGQKNLEMLDLGMAGVWNDMNEPATGNISCLDMLFDNDGDPQNHERFHNEYAPTHCSSSSR